MRVIVLGAAAGGGFPQWNSNTPACRRARAGDPAAKPRTQASLAVSVDQRDWFILNASPDLRLQIEATSALHPHEGLRSSPIAGVVLSGGDIDAIAGLLHLRERHRFTIHAAAPVLAVLRENPIFNVLSPEHVTRALLPLDRCIEIGSGLAVEAYAVPGKAPLYQEGEGFDPTPRETGDTIGLAVTETATAKTFHFIPGCALVNGRLKQRLEGADVVFFDGTLWRDDEMVRAGLGPKTGQRMGHMSVSGPDGTVAAFRDIPVGRKILVHINNSNPILLDDSVERRALTEEGWEVAHDGMEVSP